MENIYFKNFGIVIAEALASYIPVITTVGSPWEVINKTNPGWWIDIGVTPLKNTLELALNTNKEVLCKMGRNGRELVENKYSMNSVGKLMIELYEWILKKNGNKPKFIF